MVEAQAVDDPVDEIDRAIVYCLDTPGLNADIRQAFIDALLDKRNRARGLV